MHLFPACHDDVVKIIRLACKHNAAVIPYGGRYLLVARRITSVVAFDEDRINGILSVIEYSFSS